MTSKKREPWAASSPSPTPSTASTATSTPKLAAQTGFTTDDLDLFKKSLDQMFEHDRSAARGNMAPRGCIAFKHEHPLGNARADQLFSRVKIERAKPEGHDASDTNEDLSPARSFNDYTVATDADDLPEGITIEHWVQP